MILVDTSVLIDFFKGVQNDHSLCLENIIKRQIPFGITPVIYQELLQGAKNKKEYDFLDEYLKCQHFFHPLDPVMTYGKAAMIYFTCRKQGVTVRSTIDCLIARIAVEHNLILLHNDKDFIRMASVIDLKLYDV
jgi:hypothetical protein